MVTARATAPSLPTVRHRSLPPPLEGEDEIDLELVHLVRDGSLSLEDEDHLIEELAKVYRAHRDHGYEVRWRMPEMVERAGSDYQVGFEVYFMAETGLPTALTAVSVPDHGEPVYTKKIPRITFQPRPFLCPLHERSSKLTRYQLLGFKTCASSGFSNFATWEEHVNSLHESLIRSVEALGEEQVKKAMWQAAMESATQYKQARRATDPRLTESEAVVAS